MKLRGKVVPRLQRVTGYHFSVDDPARATLTLGCGHTVSATRRWWSQNPRALIECRRRHPRARP